jgi:hypothetical protein
MKNISRLLALSSVVALAALTGAADCDLSGSGVVECTTADDCADQEENTACDTSTDPGVCVAPTCAETVDCQLSDTSDESPIGASDDGCEDGTVEIKGFVEGETFCAVTPDASIDFTCADAAEGGVDASATDVDGNDVTVCVIEASTCTEGVCGAAE